MDKKYNANGGAIHNYKGTITTINANFEGNHANIGGAIANVGTDGTTATITTISGTFTGNYTAGLSNEIGYGYGGAIYNNKGTIGTITADFIDNYA